MKNDVSIVIPAYNPGQELGEVVYGLKKSGFSNIVIVDDGSTDAQPFEGLNDVTILKNNRNMGKGYALKKGFSYCKNKFKDIKGIITVDADGQHLVEDVEKVYKKFSYNYNSLILGSRNFNGKDVPLKSKIGNRIMQNKIKSKIGIDITDTQTGLRAIPIDIVNYIIDIKGERYEYETNMLLYCMNNNINIMQVPIKTVYINRNKHTHFQALKDSLKIYNVIK